MNFKHSGAQGDIIMALPTIRALSQSPSNLYLEYGVEGSYNLTRYRLTYENVLALKPLLEAQPYIGEVQPVAGQSIDVDLDDFRKVPFPFSSGSIGRYYCLTNVVAPDLVTPWLQVTPSRKFRDKILVNITERYRNPRCRYEFLAGRDDVVFCGLEQEYNVFRREYGVHCDLVTANDYLELASWIAGCKCFLGCQSMQWTLAEGLKKQPRILEICPSVANVHPIGPGAYDVFTQDMLEKVFDHVLNTW